MTDDNGSHIMMNQLRGRLAAEAAAAAASEATAAAGAEASAASGDSHNIEEVRLIVVASRYILGQLNFT